VGSKEAVGRGSPLRGPRGCWSGGDAWRSPRAGETGATRPSLPRPTTAPAGAAFGDPLRGAQGPATAAKRLDCELQPRRRRAEAPRVGHGLWARLALGGSCRWMLVQCSRGLQGDCS